MGALCFRKRETWGALSLLEVRVQELCVETRPNDPRDPPVGIKCCAERFRFARTFVYATPASDYPATAR